MEKADAARGGSKLATETREISATINGSGACSMRVGAQQTQAEQ